MLREITYYEQFRGDDPVPEELLVQDIEEMLEQEGPWDWPTLRICTEEIADVRYKLTDVATVTNLLRRAIIEHLSGKDRD